MEVFIEVITKEREGERHLRNALLQPLGTNLRQECGRPAQVITSVGTKIRSFSHRPQPSLLLSQYPLLSLSFSSDTLLPSSLATNLSFPTFLFRFPVSLYSCIPLIFPLRSSFLFLFVSIPFCSSLSLLLHPSLLVSPAPSPLGLSRDAIRHPREGRAGVNKAVGRRLDSCLIQRPRFTAATTFHTFLLL